MKLDENNNFTTVGVEPEHWSGANEVREIFKTAFNRAGLPYYNPHSFRNTIVNLGKGSQTLSSLRHGARILDTRMF